LADPLTEGLHYQGSKARRHLRPGLLLQSLPVLHLGLSLVQPVCRLHKQQEHLMHSRQQQKAILVLSLKHYKYLMRSRQQQKAILVLSLKHNSRQPASHVCASSCGRWNTAAQAPAPALARPKTCFPQTVTDAIGEDHSQVTHIFADTWGFGLLLPPADGFGVPDPRGWPLGLLWGV